MRDILVALFIVGALPVCFRRPFAGLLLFSLLAYMRLQDLTWGFARFERWSFYVAIAMGSGWLVSRDKTAPPMNLRMGLLLFLPVWVFLSRLLARNNPPLHLEGVIEYIKVVGIAVFTTMVVKRRDQLRALLWVIGLSFAFYAYKNGAATLLSGGSLYIIRGPGGMLEDNNDFALAMAMSVPILVALAMSELRPMYKRWFIGAVPLAALTVFATRSRGGFLSFALASLILTWRSKNRVIGLILMGVLGLIGLSLLPSEMFQRLDTLKDVEADASAMGRLAAWAVAKDMIVDNPIFGVGFERFQANYLDYEPAGAVGSVKTRVAHNAYLQIWSECGTPAFLAYVSLIVLSIVSLWRLRWEAQKKLERSWILFYCTGLEGAMSVFMLGSMFLNRAHFDLIYHYFAIVIVLEHVARAELRAPAVTGDEVAVPRGGLVRVDDAQAAPSSGRRRGFRTTLLEPRGRAPRGFGAGA